jgi:hypothetical protein
MYDCLMWNTTIVSLGLLSLDHYIISYNKIYLENFKEMK